MASERGGSTSEHGGSASERGGSASERGGVVAKRALTAIAPVTSSAPPAVAPPKKPHPNAKRLSLPAVRERIRKVIGTKVKKQDVQDVMQSVYLRLSMMLDTLPDDDDDLVSLAGLVAHGRVVDYLRHGLVHEGRRDEVEDLGELPVEDGAVSPEIRALWGQMLDLVEEEIGKGNIPPEVLRWGRGLAEGKTVDEMATADNVSASKIKMALKRARERLGPAWEQRLKVGAGLIVAFFVFLLFPRERVFGPDGTPPHLGRSRDRDMGAPTVPTRAEPSVPDADTFPPDSGVVTADDLRATARDACNAQQFAKCQMDLDRAAQSDPESEKRPDVIAMRKLIAKAYTSPRLKP